MISYIDYIKLMEKRGYILKNNNPIIIDESNTNIDTFSVKNGDVGKILQLRCPDNAIISACGNNHDGGCPNLYSINFQCFNDEDKEPFQDLHYSTKLTDTYHVAAEIITTKILNKDPNKIDPNYKDWKVLVNPMLKLIGSENPYEHVMWAGIYKLFSKESLNQSFNLNSNEKMILYVINPDIDITKIKFELKADIFEYNI